MVAKEISSVQHSLIKQAVSYRLDRKERERDQRVLVMGKKVLQELAGVTPIEILFYTDEPPPLPAKEAIHVSEPVMQKLTGHKASDGWAAILALPPPESLHLKKNLLILDQISDPGNLGTLWRTAFALGWDGIWLLPGSVDPFNDKALAAARGATFRLPYERIEKETILDWVKREKATLLVADLAGAPLASSMQKPPLALVLSHEGRGVSGDWPHSRKIRIPMRKGAESLNVAAAGAILLYELRVRA
jgi:TrmH family RNA methyltransferase